MPTYEAIVESHVRRWITRRRLREQVRREHEKETTPPVIPPTITVSYAYGGGGAKIAEDLSKILGFQLFDREIIEEISRNTKVPTQIIELLDEGKQELVTSLIEQMFTKRVMDDMSYVHSLARVVRSISLLEPAIFIGRGACHILRETDGFHVRFEASFDDRVKRIIEIENLPESKAKKEVVMQDQMRHRFIKTHFNRDIQDPTAYHIIINTSRIPPEEATDLVLSLYRKKANLKGG